MTDVSDSRPLRIAVLTSDAAPGLDILLADVARGSVYEVVAVVSPETAVSGSDMIETAGVPLILLPLAADEQRARYSLEARRHFDLEAADTLRRFKADFVFVIGYRYVITRELLDAFPQRVIAMHDGDLTLLDDDGGRKYRGLHAVTDAIMSGETATRSCAYVVTSNPGDGPLLLLGRRYAVPEIALDARARGAADILCRYADLHREWMVRDCWGPMLLRVIELLAAGTVQIVGETVWVDGAPAPCLMGESPDVCAEHASPVAAGIPRSCPFIKS